MVRREPSHQSAFSLHVSLTKGTRACSVTLSPHAWIENSPRRVARSEVTTSPAWDEFPVEVPPATSSDDVAGVGWLPRMP